MASSRRGGRAAPRPVVPDVTRRLATLERQVEEALAGSGQPTTLVPPLESLVDGFVDAYSRLRRAVAGEREATTELLSTPLDLLYRWWWRVDVIGLERLPARGPVLVVANRTGALLPYEAFMLARALGRPASGARPLLDDWLLGLPVAGAAARGARRRPGDGRFAAPRPRRRRGGDRLPRGPGRGGQAPRTALPAGAVRTRLAGARRSRGGCAGRPGRRGRRRGGAARAVAERVARPAARSACRAGAAAVRAAADQVDDPRRRAARAARASRSAPDARVQRAGCASDSRG